MSISESVTLDTSNVVQLASAATTAVNKLASSLRSIATINLGNNKAAELESMARAAAAGKVAEAQAKANGAIQIAQAKAVAAAQLSQQKAVQSAILAAQKSEHAQRLADIKAESAAEIAGTQAAAKIAIAADAKRAAAAKAEVNKAARAAKGSSGDLSGAFGVLLDNGGAVGSKISTIAEKMGMAATSAGVAGAAIGATVGALTTVVEKVEEAYQRISSIITSVGQMGIGMVLQATSSKEAIVAAFEGLGKSERTSEALYQKVLALSIRTGRDKGLIADEMKRLAAVGFKNDQLTQLTKMLGDVAAVKGEGRAGQLEKLMEKIQAKGSLDKGAVSKLVGMNFSQEELYKQLAKAMNKPVADIPGLIKAGKINREVAEKAIAKVVEKQVGGVAEKQANTVLALIDRIKTAAISMFEINDSQIAPVKKFLHTILSDLTGKEGAALKAAIGNLFSSIFGTAFGDLNTKAGKGMVSDVFKTITGGVNEAAAAIRSLRPEVMQLLAMLRSAMHDGTIQSLVQLGRAVGKEQLGRIKDQANMVKGQAGVVNDPWYKTAYHWATNPLGEADKDFGWGIQRRLGDMDWARNARRFLGTQTDEDKARDAAEKQAQPGAAKPIVPETSATSAMQLNGLLPDNGAVDDMKANMLDSGTSIGNSLNDGMVEGIISTMDAAVAAGGTSAQAIIDRVRAVLGVHSPSTVFAEIGGYTAQGMAQGIEAGTPHVTAAAGRMGASATMAVVPPAGAGAAAAMAGNDNGGGVHIDHLEIHANDAAGGKAAADAFAEQVAVHNRRRAMQG